MPFVLDRDSYSVAQWQQAEYFVTKYSTGVSVEQQRALSRQNIGNFAHKAGCIDKECSTPAQLSVRLASSSSKLKANAVPRLKISRDDNYVILFQYTLNCGPLCTFTDTSRCRLGRYRLQMWGEPLQKSNTRRPCDLRSRTPTIGGQ